jgi:hypothetical protein
MAAKAPAVAAMKTAEKSVGAQQRLLQHIIGVVLLAP